jgi:hypothetical protein
MCVPDAFILHEDGVCSFVSSFAEALGLAAQKYQKAPDALAALQSFRPDIGFLASPRGSYPNNVIRSLGERRFGGTVQLMREGKSALLEDVHRLGASRGLNLCPPLGKRFRKDAIRRAIASLSLLDRPEISISLVTSLRAGAHMWPSPVGGLKSGIRARLICVRKLWRERKPSSGIVGIPGDHAIESLLPEAGSKTRAALTERFLVTVFHDWKELEPYATHFLAISAQFRCS